jgi:DNA replication initiation complex subunit (GINS family)
MATATLSYDEIRRIYRLEKNTSKLVEVPDDFYYVLNEFIKQEKERYLKSLKDFSIEEARDFANMKKMVEEIFLLRQRKILNMALLSSRGNNDAKLALAGPELKTFSSVVILLEKQQKTIEEMFQANATAKTGGEKAKELDLVSVKILKEVPAFIGTDMKEYGPFSQNQTVELPFAISKLFLERKLAERNEE